jgi:3-methyladenine DNA glycosylase AlkD
MMGYDNLSNYFKTNFALMQHHKYSLSDLENMLPWERFIYIDLLKQYIKQEEDRQREEASVRRAQANIRR